MRRKTPSFDNDVCAVRSSGVFGRFGVVVATLLGRVVALHVVLRLC